MNTRKKKMLLMIGGTSIFVIAGVIIIFGLIGGILLYNFTSQEPDPVIKRVSQRPQVYVTFNDEPEQAPQSEAEAEQPAQTAAESVAEATAVVQSPAAEPESTTSDSESSESNDNSTQTQENVAQENSSQAEATQAVTSQVDTPAINASTGNSPLPTPTPTAIISDTVTVTPTSTPEPTATTASPGSISGRIVLNGAPLSPGTKLKLEDATFNQVAETTVGSDGTYTFANLSASNKGYNVLFAQEWNSQYEMDEVISWGWLGPIPVEDGSDLQLPDFETSLSGFGQVSPEPNASFSSGDSIDFSWSVYPEATKYWVDLVKDEQQNVLWRSTPVNNTSLTFDGTLNSGSEITPGEYWWGIGARRNLDSYKLTIYGYLPVLRIDP